MKLVLAVIASKSHEAFLSNWKLLKVPENMKIFYVFGEGEMPAEESVSWSQTVSSAKTVEEAMKLVIEATRNSESGRLKKILDTAKAPELRNGDELWVDCPESISPGIHLKTKAAFKYLLENEEFDILIRPNLSSLFHLEKLYTWFLDKPKRGASFGYLTFGSFLSGCGYGLTRDLIEDFVKTDFSAQDIMTEIDDMILHKYLTNKAVGRHCWEMEFYEAGKNMLASPHFHLRFKTENRVQDALEQKRVVESWTAASLLSAQERSTYNPVGLAQP